MTGKSPTRPPLASPVHPRADQLSRWAMVAGIVAFLGGWLPVLGLILGVIGVVLGLLAKRRSNRPELGLTALILSALAVLTNIVIDVIIVISFVEQINNLPG